jgi:hypothetical protein
VAPIREVRENSLPEGANLPTEAQRIERFTGVGRVRGSLRTDPPNLPLPEHWTIALVPSTSLVAGLATERRELAGTRDGGFAFEDVPLGGYDIVVDAGDLDCPRRTILLAKPESTDVFQVLVARVAGELTGRVLDSRGLGAEGFTVALARVEDGRTLETVTGPGGAYSFAKVHDGEWRLCAGSATNPLLPPRDVLFRGPRLTAPDLALPPCGELYVQVTDDHWKPIANAVVTGYGPNGGAPRVRTDEEGNAHLRWLPLGDFTVLVEREGKSPAKQHAVIALGEVEPTRVVVAR